MERAIFDRYFEPPPRLVPAAEAPPHLGGLALDPFRGELADETELHPVDRLEDAFDEAAARAILERTLGHQKVRDRLGRGRWTPIGVSRRGEPAKGERRSYLVVAYDYAADLAVEIAVDGQGELLGMADERYQPPPTDAEIERAVDLARLDARLTGRVEGLVAMAIPFAGPQDEFVNRRVLEVLFGCRKNRLPKYRAWVDLSRESVLHAGTTCDCCDGHEEAPS